MPVGAPQQALFLYPPPNPAQRAPASLAFCQDGVFLLQHAAPYLFSFGSVIYVVVSSPQCGENTAFFSGFPLGGLHG